MNKIIGQIVSAERLNNSVNGNPRFSITFNVGIPHVVCDRDGIQFFITSSDSACNYAVENYYRSGQTVELGLTRAGRVSTITPV